jgi:replication factor A1
MKVKELKPYQKKLELIVKVLEKQEPREVMVSQDNSIHKVAEALVGDETASILLSLWDESVEKVEEGKTYRIENGYTTVFKNSIRLNTGKYGSIKESEEEIEKVDEENNLSEKELNNKL